MKKRIVRLINKKYPSERRCICCGKIIKSLEPEEKNENYSKYHPHKTMWNGGIVQEIRAGYGSCHDGDIFYISICDDCIDKKVKGKILEYIGSYLSPIAKKYQGTEEEYKNYKLFLKNYENKEEGN